jgi:hypothetical protein
VTGDRISDTGRGPDANGPGNGNVLTHFTFLQAEWPAVFEAAGKAEAAVHPDP